MIEKTGCYLCGSAPVVMVRERTPGSKGTSGSSIASTYWLCRPCIKRAEAAGAVDRWQEKSRKPRRDEEVTVFAKTYQWLKATVPAHAD